VEIADFGEDASLLEREFGELAEEEDGFSESRSTHIWRNREDSSETRFAVTSNSSEGVSSGSNGSLFLGFTARARVSLLIVVEHLSSQPNVMV